MRYSSDLYYPRYIYIKKPNKSKCLLYALNIGKNLEFKDAYLPTSGMLGLYYVTSFDPYGVVV